MRVSDWFINGLVDSSIIEVIGKEGVRESDLSPGRGLGVKEGVGRP